MKRIILFLLLIFPVSVFATPALVAKAIAGSSNGTTVTTVAINCTGATFALVTWDEGAGAVKGTLADSSSNTWTALTSYLSNSTSGIRLNTSYVASPTVTSSQTVSITASTFPSVSFRCYSGVLAASPFDVQGGQGSNSSVATFDSGTITPGSTTYFGITSAGWSVGAVSAITVNSSFINLDSIANNGNHYALSSADKITVAATEDPTFSWTTSSDASVQVSTFKPSAGGGATLVSYKSLMGAGR